MFSLCDEPQDSQEKIALPYNQPEGYELRLVDDEGSIIDDMAPLDRSKTLAEYALDVAAFCKKQNYHQKSPTCRAGRIAQPSDDREVIS